MFEKMYFSEIFGTLFFNLNTMTMVLIDTNITKSESKVQNTNKVQKIKRQNYKNHREHQRKTTGNAGTKAH